MLNTVLHKLGEILQKPFREHFLFLVAFFFLATSPYFFWHPMYVQGFNIYILYLAIHCFVLSYLVTLLVSLIKPDIARKIVQGILIALAAILFAVNFYCNFVLDFLFDADIAMLILGTDVHETKEFASALLPTWIILAVLGVYVFFIALWWISKRHRLNLGKKTSWIALGVLFICAILSIRNWRAWEDGPLKLFEELSNIESSDDLQSYYTHPDITIIDKSQMPANVVLIIGESFARVHSSLYGYDKPTNPELGACRDSSMLFTFDNIDAPAPTTAQSLRFMLSAYAQSDDASSNEKKWYEYTTIIELMQDCGFDCYWFSNQARGNKHNSTARAFAEACNKHWFLQQEGSDRYNVTPDKVLVDSSYQFVNQLQSTGHHFIIYHMMGSHYEFSMRYPQEFAKFTENDYLTEPQSHRTILASYDNSILYNDYIVHQILNLYKDKDAIVIYIPDHGQVMYRDPKDPDYYAHGKMNNKVRYALGVEVPFMIYASPLYQEKHPETMQRIKYRQDHPKAWNSDDLPYLIMDLIGVKDINGEEVKPKSVLD
jgi:heptose-I-phosphate ethanolaminephosphotransferase